MTPSGVTMLVRSCAFSISARNLRLAAAGVVLGAFAVGDLLEQGAVEQGEFGGALAHAVFEFLVGALEGFGGAAARGDVLDRALVAQQPAVGVADGAGVLRNPDARAVGAVDFRLHAGDDALRFEPRRETRRGVRGCTYTASGVVERGDERLRRRDSRAARRRRG